MRAQGPLRWRHFFCSGKSEPRCYRTGLEVAHPVSCLLERGLAGLPCLSVTFPAAAAMGAFGSPASGKLPATSGAGVEELGNEVAASRAEEVPGDHSEGMFWAERMGGPRKTI